MNGVMLTRIIDLPLHDYNYVIRLSYAAMVLVLVQARVNLLVYVHIASYAHFDEHLLVYVRLFEIL